jgi:hypothetical protein
MAAASFERSQTVAGVVFLPDKNGDPDRQGDELYERYGKPLETEHWGEFVAISPEGKTVLGKTLKEAAEAAMEHLGHGHSIYKL